MLVDLYPRVHRRYTSLAIIGPILDGYGTWLLRKGYSTERTREHFQAAPRLVRGLQQRGVRALTSLTRARLWACAPTDSQEDPNLAVLVRQLARYCESELALYPPPTLTRIEQRVAAYRTYLQQVRGFAPGTLAHHGRTAGEFLAHIGYETHPARRGGGTRNDGCGPAAPPSSKCVELMEPPSPVCPAIPLQPDSRTFHNGPPHPSPQRRPDGVRQRVDGQCGRSTDGFRPTGSGETL